MGVRPQRAKAHSQQMADEYLRLGWFLTHEFRAAEGEEPYEFVFVWRELGQPAWPEGIWPPGSP